MSFKRTFVYLLLATLQAVEKLSAVIPGRRHSASKTRVNALAGRAPDRREFSAAC
jgi:hypothetical protein